MNISLPTPLKAFVDEQVAGGSYSSTSEYVRELLRQAQRRQAEERLEQLLLEGLESGEPVDMTRQDWENIRSEALARFKERQSAKPG